MVTTSTRPADLRALELGGVAISLADLHVRPEDWAEQTAPALEKVLATSPDVLDDDLRELARKMVEHKRALDTVTAMGSAADRRERVFAVLELHDAAGSLQRELFARVVANASALSFRPWEIHGPERLEGLTSELKDELAMALEAGEDSAVARAVEKIARARGLRADQRLALLGDSIPRDKLGAYPVRQPALLRLIEGWIAEAKRREGSPLSADTRRRMLAHLDAFTGGARLIAAGAALEAIAELPAIDSAAFGAAKVQLAAFDFLAEVERLFPPSMLAGSVESLAQRRHELFLARARFLERAYAPGSAKSDLTVVMEAVRAAVLTLWETVSQHPLALNIPHAALALLMAERFGLAVPRALA